MSRFLISLSVAVAGCATEERQLRKECEDARIRLASALETIEQYRAAYGPLEAIAPADSWKVVAVNGRRVAVTLGSKDGARAGDVLYVRHGFVYVGKLRIVTVSVDTCTADFFDAVAPAALPCMCDEVFR